MWPGETPSQRPSLAPGMFIKRLFRVWRSPSSFCLGERALVRGSRPAGWLSPLAVGAVKTLQHTGEADVEQSDLVLQLFSFSSTLGPLGLPRQ